MMTLKCKKYLNDQFVIYKMNNRMVNFYIIQYCLNGRIELLDNNKVAILIDAL